MNMQVDYYLEAPQKSSFGYTNTYDKIERYEKVRKSVNTSSKWSGVSGVFYFTDLGMFINNQKYNSGFKNDIKFNISDSQIMNILDENNLVINDYSTIAQAKNIEHLKNLIKLAKLEKSNLHNIVYTLNNYGDFAELKVITFAMHTLFDYKTYISIILLIIGYFTVKKLLLFIYRKVVAKTQEYKRKIYEYKIKTIAEEESIRVSVKKSMDNSEDESDLQNLINKAVASGDSETAQALLKILNSKKN
ncbi:hypothetical protein [Candidatus Sulfurimonas baltica]|uniref:Uncharacterized protein n=1 Tax=Candidatus Sulfurimonas baltica TaxID=2740404 RepID=A0A7S7RM25_9BACT|nr:hypothetical protein [Candidatus Sulfurimonas baltica]QOY50998.1 hypothetical protein HUE88_07545 [Candidatus Sulfurimonas baltica]